MDNSYSRFLRNPTHLNPNSTLFIFTTSQPKIRIKSLNYHKTFSKTDCSFPMYIALIIHQILLVDCLATTWSNVKNKASSFEFNSQRYFPLTDLWWPLYFIQTLQMIYLLFFLCCTLYIYRICLLHQCQYAVTEYINKGEKKYKLFPLHFHEPAIFHITSQSCVNLVTK